MNLQPLPPQSGTPGEPPDAALDALLDQALAVGEVPADLQDRILALTDPAFNAQLDRALAPQAMPEGLQSRVMQRINETLDAQASPVLARLGPARPAWVGYAAAAAVVLVTGVAFYFVAGSAGPAAPHTLADHAATDEPLEGVLEEAFAFTGEAELDQRMSLLESRILSVSDEPIWGNDDDFQRELWLELAPEGEAEGLLF